MSRSIHGENTNRDMTEQTEQKQNKKKLLLVVPMLHQGGFERVCVETARIMRDVYDVTVLIFTDRDAHYDVSGLNVINIDVPAREGKAAKAWNLFRRRHRIRQVKRRLGIDITYSFGSTANLANVMSRAGDRIVTSMRSALDFDAPDRLRRILDGSDLMISCSAEMERMLRERYGFRKTALLYNPLDTERILRLSGEAVPDHPFPDASPLIVTTGRDDDAKGYWHLIKAFSALRRHLPDARLMIIGDGGMHREKRLIGELRLADHVVLTGVKKNPFAYMANADLFVLTSNHEGFPNALVEAMALGLPVIACDCISGPREILLSGEECESVNERFPDGTSVRDAVEGAYGILIPDMDDRPDYNAQQITPDDMMLCTVLRRILESPEALEEYGARAAKRAESFSVGKYKTRLQTILEKGSATG